VRLVDHEGNPTTLRAGDQIAFNLEDGGVTIGREEGWLYWEIYVGNFPARTAYVANVPRQFTDKEADAFLVILAATHGLVVERRTHLASRPVVTLCEWPTR